MPPLTKQQRLAFERWAAELPAEERAALEATAAAVAEKGGSLRDAVILLLRQSGHSERAATAEADKLLAEPPTDWRTHLD